MGRNSLCTEARKRESSHTGGAKAHSGPSFRANPEGKSRGLGIKNSHGKKKTGSISHHDEGS